MMPAIGFGRLLESLDPVQQNLSTRKNIFLEYRLMLVMTSAPLITGI